MFETDVSAVLFCSPKQASDPSTFELIQKIHTLQKRLISKTEEVVEKELLLQVAFPFSILAEQADFLSTIISRTMFLVSYLAELHAPFLTVDGNRDLHTENNQPD